MANIQLDKAIEMIIDSYKNGGKLLVCGNGGSASDSAHIVGELVKGFLKKRPLPAEWSEALDGANLQMGLPAIDLTAQGAVIAAVVNDLGGEYMYAQQVMAYGNPGDVIIGISTSGNAQNVDIALRTARALGLVTIGLCGRSGGKMRGTCDILLNVDADETYLIQEKHLPLYHALCAGVEAHFFKE